MWVWGPHLLPSQKQELAGFFNSSHHKCDTATSPSIYSHAPGYLPHRTALSPLLCHSADLLGKAP